MEEEKRIRRRGSTRRETHGLKRTILILEILFMDCARCMLIMTAINAKR